jgi:hypothetical protein
VVLVLELLALPVLPALPVLARPSLVVTTPEHASMVTTGSTQAITDRITAGAPSKRRAAKNLEDLAVGKAACATVCRVAPPAPRPRSTLRLGLIASSPH